MKELSKLALAVEPSTTMLTYRLTSTTGDIGVDHDEHSKSEPNHTGTNAAYLPPGHDLRGGKRDRATGDYEAWQP